MGYRTNVTTTPSALSAADAASGRGWFYTYDGNGNVSEVFGDTGESLATYLYDPFGNVAWEAGPVARENRWRFSTKLEDAETGLCYYGFRYYPAEMGRWLGRDPIGEEGGVNLYGFVGNDGISGKDMVGLWDIERKRQRTAKATNECGDTPRDLAREAKLNIEEIAYWAPDLAGRPFDDPIFEEIKVEIPNTIIASVGGTKIHPVKEYFWGLNPIQIAVMREVSSRALARQSQGFKVELVSPETKSSFLTRLSRNDIHGFVLGGHGSPGSVTMADYTLTSYDVHRTIKYKLANVYIYACEAGAAISSAIGGSFSDIVSDEGYIRVHTEKIHILTSSL